MVIQFDFSSYLSAFTWRYGSEEMRRLFSEQHKYGLWRKIWVILAETQYSAGLVSKEELDDLKKHELEINIERILEIEKETRHDVVAAIKEYAEKAKVGGGKIHLGATSFDIVDNADSLRIMESLKLIGEKLDKVIVQLGEKIEDYASLPCIGYTHLQAAEPTTVGFRLAFYAQDLLICREFLKFARENVKAKGMKGTVGTSASYEILLKGKKMSAKQLDELVTKKLGLVPALITSQTSPKIFDFIILSVLAGISSCLAKFAGDLRLLQSANTSEWSEPFAKKQVGSSAMPFKKNPISSENICSLARYVASLPEIALGNATLSYLERTLDDSANKRIIVAEAFLATDQILTTAGKIIFGLVINKQRIAYNLKQYAPFAATEVILMEAVKRGANRQEIHEVLRDISLKAWQEIQAGKANPMKKFLTNDMTLKKYLKKDEIHKQMDVKNHIGNAPKRALKLAKQIRKKINEK